MEAPLPPDEADRIAALYELGLLDTGPEDRFDRLTRLATYLFDVPIALVSLVDTNRQWFKSCIGLPDPEMPRSVSFCAHAILSDDVFLIEDAQADPRFWNNPLVTGPPHIRFYAGQPLRGPRGRRLGTLCIIDRRPRQLSGDERAALRDLAAIVETEMDRVDLQQALQAQDVAQRELARVRGQLSMILNTAAEAIVGIEPSGRVSFVNAAGSALFGYPVDRLVGADLHALAHHHHEDGTPYAWEECPTRQTLTRGIGHRVANEVYWRSDGTWFPAEYSAAPMVEDGEVIGAVLIISDVSHRRAVDRMKDEFISVVSHELRTPLTSIRGSLGLIAGGMVGEVAPEAAEMLHIAITNTDRLIRLINDILDLERIESGAIAMERQPTAAVDLIADAVESVAALSRSAGVTIAVDLPDVVLDVDPDRVTQMLTNLLGNAVKFSPAGSRIDVKGATTGSRLHLRVIDQGRGIPADRLERIFGRFEQVDQSDSRERGGTGLGLAISRTIAEQHDGRIWAESTLGRGSTFHVLLPLAGVAPPRRTPTDERPRVLIWRPAGSEGDGASRWLEEHGFAVTEIGGEGDVVAVSAATAPDVILADRSASAPTTMAGLAALRANEDTRDIPIVVVDLLPGAGGGATGEELLGSLLAVLGQRRSPRVLVVEDDEDLAQVLVAFFAHHGLETYHAVDQPAAIDLAARVAPDLLVIDLILPEGDGYGVVDWLRREGLLPRIPVVVYTAADVTAHDRSRLEGTTVLGKTRVPTDEFQLRLVTLIERIARGGDPA